VGRQEEAISGSPITPPQSVGARAVGELLFFDKKSDALHCVAPVRRWRCSLSTLHRGGIPQLFYDTRRRWWYFAPSSDQGPAKARGLMKRFRSGKEGTGSSTVYFSYKASIMKRLFQNTYTASEACESTIPASQSLEVYGREFPKYARS
jgi:hypothetical protein